MNEEKNNFCEYSKWKEPKTILIFLSVILLTGIVVVSILRDRIVNQSQNQVTVMGRGETEYKPDTALINLGVQIDKASTSENALGQLNEKMNKIIESVKALGIPEEDIKTKEYNLYPQYEYKDGTSKVSGYSANQQLSVKIKNIIDNSDLPNKVVSEASRAGVNQILGINFEVSNLNDLKQQARILAIKDAKSKSGDMAKAAGIKKLKKVVGWYETEIESPDVQNRDAGLGAGGMEVAKVAPSPNVPSGNQKIVIEVGLNYEVD